MSEPMSLSKVSFPGFAVHQELLRLVEAGLTNFEALAAGTRNPGITVERMVGDGNFGTVVTGSRADLILLPNNPLEDVSHTQERLGVMVRGMWFTQAELNGLADANLLLLLYSGRNPKPKTNKIQQTLVAGS